MPFSFRVMGCARNTQLAAFIEGLAIHHKMPRQLSHGVVWYCLPAHQIPRRLSRPASRLSGPQRVHNAGVRKRRDSVGLCFCLLTLNYKGGGSYAPFPHRGILCAPFG